MTQTSWGRLSKAQREQVWTLKRDAPDVPWTNVATTLELPDFSPTCTRKAREYVETRRNEYIRELRKQDAAEFVQAFIGFQKAYRRLQQVRTELTICIEETKPFAMAFPADWHTGGFGTDHETLTEHVKMMGGADGLYIEIGGDIHDSMVNPKIIDNSQPHIPPGSELIVVAYYCTLLREQLKVVCNGNHTNWLNELVGLDGMQWLADEVGVLHAADACLLTLRCAGAEYKIARTHKYRYSSSFNLTHTVKRLWEMGPWNFDVGIVEHQHVPAMEPFWKQGEQKLALRPGTYKTMDGWAIRQGFFGAKIGVPIVYFWPDVKRMEWQPSWELGRCLEYLGWLRR